MTAYIARRLVMMIPVLIGVSLLVFLITRLTPGDPVRELVGPDASQQKVEEARAKLGLDKPVVTQYLYFVRDALKGDLGTSLRTRQPVTHELMSRFPVTLQLSFFTVVLAVAIGVPLGVLSAVHAGSFIDRAATVTAVFFVSMPLFWVAIMATLVFSIRLGWLPPAGVDGSIWTWSGFQSYILPSITLALGPSALLMRITRSSMLEVLNREYVTVARAKGLSERNVIIRHAFRNALLPVITYIGLLFGALLGGAVVTETIFALPGAGRLVVTAINQRDYPIIQGAVLMLALIFTTINLIVDLLYALLDPRISYE